MKGRSITKKSIIGLLMLPINLLATILSVFLVVGIRALDKAKKKHVRLESLEKGNKWLQ